MPRLASPQTIELSEKVTSIVVRAEADNLTVLVPGLNDPYPDVLMNGQSQIYRLHDTNIKTFKVTGTGNFVWSPVAKTQ